MALFEIRNLTFTYPGQKKPALTDLSFSLEQGEFLDGLRKSGCGKSTLLRLLKRPWSPYGERKGQILLEGREPGYGFGAGAGGAYRLCAPESRQSACDG